MGKKYVYLFREGSAAMRDTLGGKGANLAEMTALGLPVPPGFTVSAEACTLCAESGGELPSFLRDEIFSALSALEESTGKRFGSRENPLLVSVRSGARVSMPGMMDTVLNLGMNEAVAASLAEASGNPRWAWDCFRRFIQMYGDVVAGVPKAAFEALLDEKKAARGVTADASLTADELRTLCTDFRTVFRRHTGADFPDAPADQLTGAVRAVFRSWDNPRAEVYRRMNGIPYAWGTAVNVQAMVFGNMGDDCGTGVAFTRNPATGEKKIFGEFLVNAQGEDVVAGVRTPLPISELEARFPEAWAQFTSVCETLEKHCRDMQDMEFTVEHGRLYMLQTRNGKRTPAAALKIACDLADEGRISVSEAVMLLDAKSLDTLLHPQFDARALQNAPVLATALAASPGAASGSVVFTAEDARRRADAGEKVILVRQETSPEDIEGMRAAQGILTARGGMTSHAAVVARGMGKCCVSGCGALRLDTEKRVFTLGGKLYREGDALSLDGATGHVYAGELPVTEASLSGDFARVMGWADTFSRMDVRANADTPEDAARALRFGAKGIGLCRTEHMFFAPERVPAIREMICADSPEARKAALDRLEPMQQSDFEAIFEAMQGKSVTVRLLDPPLHEFVPTAEKDIRALAERMGKSVPEIRSVLDALHEVNPMLGHRGCRLAVTYPEIAVMQTRAVIRAALHVRTRHPEWNVVPEIMIPLVGEAKELYHVRELVTRTADALIAETGSTLRYQVGTMIEVPRAALTADAVASEADFFSFGTNDLTQMTFGLSRDDAGKFLGDYYAKRIFERDPFETLDRAGVGKLIETACRLGRAANPALKLGLCGEHGGNAESIEFCHRAGLDYVSCSPYRVPAARLACAQAAIRLSQ